MELPVFSVSGFIAALNQTLEYAYSTVTVEGEVSSFKVNQNKYVFFDIKDSEGSISCFMSVWQLKVPIQDGMKVVVVGQPRLTKWGKFSITVRSVRPLGEGSIKKSQEILKAKLEKEGLFATDRKRLLPDQPNKIAVISSTGAAGYADFIKILNQRWGGLNVDVAHTQVQGEVAADQIIRAIKHFNEQLELADVLVIIRGGGSADDLRTFDDESLVREIAGSRIPVLTGIGHETDITLADMASDVRAATPSNAAQIVVPDRHDNIASSRHQVGRIAGAAERSIDGLLRDIDARVRSAKNQTISAIDYVLGEVRQQRATLAAYDPQAVLRRGYAVMRGEAIVGEVIELETNNYIISAEVKNVETK